jgi:hypothetical protein
MSKTLQIHDLVFVHGYIDFPEGNKLVRGWGKVNSPGDQSVHVELATGLVGDDWAEIGGERFYEDEDDDRIGTVIVIARDDVFTTEEIEPGEDPQGRPRHIPAPERKAAFLKVAKGTGLDFDDELDQYEGGRYVVMCYDGGLGTFWEANTLQDLAACIGGLLASAFAYGGWYDLDDEDPHPHAASWAVTVSHGEDFDTADGDVLV